MKRILTIGVILLFIGMSISSSTGFNLEKQSTTPLNGKTLYVGGLGPGNYSKIQDAIDNASNGDTVYVYNGAYVENVLIDKSINLIGENKDTTIIDGGGSGDVVYISADWVNISLFTIQNSGKYPFNAGIEIRFKYSKITNNKILNNQEGIILWGDNYTIIGNNISNNHNGTYAPSSSSGNIIKFNIISFNDEYGMSLNYSCHNNIINRNNISSNNKEGMRLWGNNNYNTIQYNNISSNNEGGIFLNYCFYNTINNNTISSNKGAAIYLSQTNNITISGNNILNNSDGTYLSWCNDNIIYHNNFINNMRNGYDNGNNNWDNGYPSGGNYWDDYTGKDSNWDGIGDTPYPIPGGDNEDRYPLMEPYAGNRYFIGSMGPICPLLNIAEITLIDGNESQMQKIEKILNNRLLQFIIPQMYFVNVTDLNFTISYTKKIPKIPFWWNFEYITILTENGNLTHIDKPHIVTVKGFNGAFYPIRGKLLIIYPPHFLFAGVSEEFTIEYPKGV